MMVKKLAKKEIYPIDFKKEEKLSSLISALIIFKIRSSILVNWF